MEVGSSGGGMDWERAGTRVLRLLAVPLNGLILHRLSEGPRRFVELRREAGSLRQATLRAGLKDLSRIRAIAKRRLHPFPSVREYVLAGQPGRELRFVAVILEAWLAKAPDGPIPPGTVAAQEAIAALAGDWSRCRSGGTPSLDGDWLRQAVAPIAAAIRWERNHLPSETVPLIPRDVEAAFLQAAPLLGMPAETSGSCRMGVRFSDAGESHLAGATMVAEDGRVVSCTTGLEMEAGAWVEGNAAAWLRAVIEADPSRLELGGERRLAQALLDGLNRALFPPRVI